MFTRIALILGLTGQALASPCPFAHLHKRSSGEEVKRILEERQILGGLLGGGGGLLGGVLQPLSGALQGLDIPTPQPTGLAVIPPDGDAAHAYIAPGPTDIRGLCPTMNTLANHGYIARNGITTFAESANAIQTAYGFGYDLSVFLAAVALLNNGDLLTGKYSIGGQDSRVPNSIPGLIAYGLDYHDHFEVDGSVNRVDAYFGDDHSFSQTRWNSLVALSKQYDNGNFGRDLFVQENKITYDNSRSTNPQFTALAKYFVVAQAERTFIYNGLPNGTNEGLANYANIAPFYLNQTFPNNWFRRGTPYTLADTVENVLDIYTANPFELGENQGLNNFVPLSMNIPSTPEEVGCLFLTAVLDAGAGDAAQDAATAVKLYNQFFNGILAPIFDSAGYKCNLTDFYTDGGSGSGVKPISG